MRDRSISPLPEYEGGEGWSLLLDTNIPDANAPEAVVPARQRVSGHRQVAAAVCRERGMTAQV